MADQQPADRLAEIQAAHERLDPGTSDLVEDVEWLLAEVGYLRARLAQQKELYRRTIAATTAEYVRRDSDRRAEIAELRIVFRRVAEQAGKHPGAEIRPADAVDIIAAVTRLRAERDAAHARLDAVLALPEADPDHAPVHYDNETASAWCAGYEHARSQARAAAGGGTDQ